MKSVTKFVSAHAQQLTTEEKRYMTDFDYETSYFYGPPKIRKSKSITSAILEQNSEMITTVDPNDLKRRPIIAGLKCPTHRLSHFIDAILQPLAKQVTAHVKDDFDVLRKLPPNLGKE